MAIVLDLSDGKDRCALARPPGKERMITSSVARRMVRAIVLFGTTLLVASPSVATAVRADAQPAPSPRLAPLCYSSTVQQTAQAWANGCNWKHNPGRAGSWARTSRPSRARCPTRLCTRSSSGPAKLPTTTNASNGCSGVCGHYTQIVWRSSQRLGCGVAVCTTGSPWGSPSPSWTYVVCNYDPPGNYVGQRPY
jgi:pathogenesis-related protein 1